jgi:DNA-binding NtrC family response regulator
MSTLLIVDDEESFARNAAKFLARAGHEVLVAHTLAEASGMFDEGGIDAVVLDYRLPDGTGFELLGRIRARDPHVYVLLVTGHGTIELAVEAMKAGANDLLTKPVSLGDLRERLNDIDRRQRAQKRLDYYESRERLTAPDMLGDSDVMQQLRQRISRVANVAGDDRLPPVLITGETGTGKELVARACHFDGPRRDRPFIEINCAAIPNHLLESELFGHERGAFTDAKERKLGLIEAADGGTLFLDEVAEMDLVLQAKLLKVIEDGRLRRLGAVQERQVQVRIVAATHQALEARVADGQFRADLYYRLRVLQLAVPPLRERGGDVLLLARHFCQQFGQRYHREAIRLSAAAEAALARHPWPGNVRELRNVMEQAVLLGSGEVIEADELMPMPAAVAAAPGQAEPLPAPATREGESALERVEREMLLEALLASGQNVSLAARRLGVSRDTLRYRIEKHGLRL